MTLDELFETPEWKAAAESTRKEFGLDRVGNPSWADHIDTPCFEELGAAVTSLSFDRPSQPKS